VTELLIINQNKQHLRTYNFNQFFMQSNSAANIKRREKDVMKLMMCGKYQIHLTKEDATNEFEVLFEAPEDSLYKGVSKTRLIFV